MSCDVDAAGFGAGAPVANLLLLSFLCSPLCNSAADASSFTSLLRSNLSAPCGLTLRHSSIRNLQRSEWACALFVVFECVDTCASNSGPEFVDVLLGDSFSLDSCSFKWQWRDWNWVHLNFWSVHCPPAVCHSPKYSNDAVDAFFVPFALRFQSSDFTSSESTICIPTETCGGFAFQAKSHSFHGIRGDFLCQHFLTKWYKLL